MICGQVYCVNANSYVIKKYSKHLVDACVVIKIHLKDVKMPFSGRLPF